MIKSTSNAAQYQWGKKCIGWLLLKSDSLTVIQEIIPPGESEKTHYHKRSQQLFFILEGKATFEVDGKTLTLKPQDSIHIKPGIKHRILNKMETNLHFLVISEPNSHGDKFS